MNTKQTVANAQVGVFSSGWFEAAPSTTIFAGKQEGGRWLSETSWKEWIYGGVAREKKDTFKLQSRSQPVNLCLILVGILSIRVISKPLKLQVEIS